VPEDPAAGAPDPAAAATVARLRAEIAAKDAVIATLEARIGQLDAQVIDLQARLRANSSNSSKPPSADGLAKGPPRPDRAGRHAAQARTRRKPGGQPGAPGAYLAQVEHPDVVVVHAPKRCQRCGGELADAPMIGAEVRQVHDLPQRGLLVTEHRAERRRCGCGAVTAATFPDGVRAPACYGPGVRAAVAYLHGQQHLPIERTAQALADLVGAEVAAGTVAAILAECADGLDGFIDAVRAQLAAAPVAHFDETGASSSSALSCGVEVLELDAGVFGGEPPVDPTTGSVARCLPGGGLPLQGRPVGQPAVQALSGQHGQFDLGHVQPAAVLGRVVQLQLVGEPPGLGRWERRIQRGGGVGVEVVLDQHDLFGVGVVDVDQVLDGSGPSRCGCAGR